MVTTEQIKNQLKELRSSLKDIKTLHDCTTLVSRGFAEYEILVSIAEGCPIFLDDAKSVYPDLHNTKIRSVGLPQYGNVSATYYTEKDDFIFDIYASEDDEYPILVDVTLEDLTESMEEYMKRG